MYNGTWNIIEQDTLPPVTLIKLAGKNSDKHLVMHLNPHNLAKKETFPKNFLGYLKTFQARTRKHSIVVQEHIEANMNIKTRAPLKLIPN